MPALVLLSGGLDSVVLAAAMAREGTVHPVHVSVGLAWEAAELAAIEDVLAAPPLGGRVEPLATLRFEMRDIYAPTHWAVMGRAPEYDTPDEDVYLAGRNLVLLTKAGVLAAGRGLSRIALGPLAGNPFPDARPAFFDAMATALSLGLDHPIAVTTPLAGMHKDAVIRLGVELGVPMERTLSCMQPLWADTPAGRRPLHCGRCSKCRERRDAFTAAGVPDLTTYAAASPRQPEAT
ncbi:MAG: 7-cyano-7-deazaguanine synthase [Vicinamibacterales bacterium]